MIKSMKSVLTAAVVASLVTTVSYAGPMSWREANNYMPVQQRQFCDLALEYRKDLAEAEASRNDIKINIAKQKRQEDLDALLPEGKFTDWLARVVSVKQVMAPDDDSVDGDVALVTELWCEIQVGSGELEFGGQKKWGATIDHGSRMYREARKVNAGDFVILSGNFLTVQDFQPNQKETFYASRSLTSDELTVRAEDDDRVDQSKYGNGSELFLANVSYMAAAN